MKRKLPEPPSDLNAETAEWFAEVVNSFELESHHVRLLTLAARAWERAEEARLILDAEGLTYTDRFGAPRSRPEIAVERDSRLAFARLLREMALDLEPPPEARKPRRGGY
jgi:hypothetical protein